MSEIAVAISTYETERGKPMPSKNHAIIQARLIILLYKLYGAEYTVLSELSLALGHHARVPDLALYKNISFDPLGDEVRMTEMPLAVVEILSPKQGMSELLEKCSEYFAAGVQSYWMVLPGVQSIYVFSAREKYAVFTNGEKLVDTVLDIEMDTKEVFR